MEAYETPKAIVMLKRGGAVAALCSIVIGLSAEISAEASTTVARNDQEYRQAQSDYTVALQQQVLGRSVVLSDLLNFVAEPMTGDSPASIPALVVPAPRAPLSRFETLQSQEASVAQAPNPATLAPKVPRFNVNQPEKTNSAPVTTAHPAPARAPLKSLAPIEVTSPSVAESQPLPSALPTTEAAPPVATPPKTEAPLSLPEGDTRTQAREILKLSPRITFQIPAEKAAFQHIADTGKAIDCGGPAVSAKLLGILRVLAEKYDIVVGVLTDGHECDKLEHPKGNAVDINGINYRDGSPGGTGNHISGDVGDFNKPLVRQFYKDAGELLAANGGGALAQFECFKDANGDLKVGGVFYYKRDTCKHIHMDDGTTFASQSEPIKDAAPAPTPPTPPPAVPEIPPTAAEKPRRLAPFSLAPKVVDPSGPDPDPRPKPRVPAFSLTVPEPANVGGSNVPSKIPPTVGNSPSNPAPTTPDVPPMPSIAPSAPAAPAAPAPAITAPTAPEAPSTSEHISVDKAIKMLPGADPQTVSDIYPMMIAALKEVGIDDYQMERYTFATISAETATCLPIKEMGSKAYLEGKDYFPYFGRGFIQLTWDYNYQAAGDALGLDLINNPDLALDPQNAVRILAWYMKGHEGKIRSSLNKGNLEGARAAVNGRRGDGHPNGMTEFNRGWHAGA